MCSSATVGGRRADTIQEFADALDIPWRKLPFFHGYGRKDDSWTNCCLCGVNIPLAAKRNGYTCEQDEWDGMGYVLTKKDPAP